MNKKKMGFTLCCGAMMLLSGCAINTTSRDWNGLVGPDAHPNYYKSTKKVAVKLFIIVPLVGDVGIDGMIDELTEDIVEDKGNKVRIVQANSENYWHGFPPFTWIITPVISTVAAQYEPDETKYEADQEEIRKKEESWQKYSPMNL